MGSAWHLSKEGQLAEIFFLRNSAFFNSIGHEPPFDCPYPEQRLKG